MEENLQGGSRLPSLSGAALKFIALVAMTVDHIGYIIFPSVTWFRIVGRLAYPIFAYFIAEGCFYTRHKLRYFLNLFIMGAACDVVGYIFTREYSNCILTTFALSVLIIFGLDSLKKGLSEGDGKRSALSALWVLGAAAAAVLLGCFEEIFSLPYIDIDYGIAGILTPVLVWAVKDRKLKLAALSVGLLALALILGGNQPYALFAVVPFMFYNGERGKHPMKYFFYIYYPLHLAAIYGIYCLIQIL